MTREPSDDRRDAVDLESLTPEFFIQPYLDTLAALTVCITANQPVILWGPPGQGKSTVIEQIAADQGLQIETVIASIREPSDFAGLPVVDPATGSVRLAPPDWAARLAATNPPGGLVFYDEISTAPPAVQAALLRPVLTGWVGDIRLPAEVRTVAAANPPDLAAGGWDLSAALANRFVHLDWELPTEVICRGFTTGWPELPVPMCSDTSAAELAAVFRGLIAAFLSARPDLSTQVPTTMQAGRAAFPTPRSWWAAAKVCGHARAAGSGPDVEHLLLAATVGAGPAVEFATYCAELDLPEPETVLAAPDDVRFDPARPDRIFAVVNSAWALVEHRMTPQRWVAFGALLAHLTAQGHPDIAYTASRPWARHRPRGTVPSPATMTALAPMLEDLALAPESTLLTAAGSDRGC